MKQRIGVDAASFRFTRKAKTQERLRNAGAEPVGSTADEFAAFLAADHDKWAKVIKAANIAVEREGQEFARASRKRQDLTPLKRSPAPTRTAAPSVP